MPFDVALAFPFTTTVSFSFNSNRSRVSTGKALPLSLNCTTAMAWAASAAARGQLDNAAEINEALNAAEAVGDDRIMESAGQEVNPESFTHGTSEQRRTWFERGFTTGDPEQCRTFDNALAP